MRWGRRRTARARESFSSVASASRSKVVPSLHRRGGSAVPSKCARNRLAADDRHGARSSLEEGLAEAARHGHCATCNALLLPEAVRVELAWDDLRAAAGYASKLEDVAGRFGSRAWIAMAEHARGRVHAARGETGEAFEALERARRGYADIGFSYEAARCMAAQSRLKRASADDVRRALEALGASACDS